jgi:outer membrane protein
MKKLPLTLALCALCYGISAPAEDLLEVYRLAQQHDPKLREVAAQRDAVLEGKSLATARLLPSAALSLGGNYVFSNVEDSPAGGGSDDFASANLGISLYYPVYRRDYLKQLEQTDSRIAEAEAGYVATEQELIYRVAEAYFKVLQTQDNLTFAESQNAAFARQLEQAQQRFDVGLIAVTSVHEAKAAYDQSRSELIKAQYDVDNAWEALYEIINQRPETLARLLEEIPLDSPEPKNIEQWSEQAQQQNLSIQAANYAAAAARQEIEVQSSGSYPQVSLVGRHDVDRTDREYGSDTDTTMVGLQLELPLYTGGAVEAATRQARYQYQAATEALDGQRRAVHRQVRDAYRGIEASIAAVEALQAAIVSAESALEATQAGFEVGTRTMVDVLNAERDLFSARSQHAAVRYSYILSRLRLLLATGTLSQADLELVNSWLTSAPPAAETKG